MASGCFCFNLEAPIVFAKRHRLFFSSPLSSFTAELLYLLARRLARLLCGGAVNQKLLNVVCVCMMDASGGATPGPQSWRSCYVQAEL